MPSLYLAPTNDFVQKTLSGALNDSATTITLNNTTNLQTPGTAVIDRVNSAGTATPNAREVITYTGVSGNDLTGVTRGVAGSTAQAHSSGAIVEFTLSSQNWNNLATIVATTVTTDGYLKAIPSPATIARLEAPFARIPSALISIATVLGQLNASGASLVGFGINPTFVFTGNLSGPTTLLQTPLVMPRAGQWEWINVLTRTVASGASAIIDVNRNGTSVFDAGTRPAIAGGGTLVSTASIATKNFNQGDRLSWDYDTTGGYITDLTIILKGQ